MELYKVLVTIALLVACALAVQSAAIEPEEFLEQKRPSAIEAEFLEQKRSPVGPAQENAPLASANHNREKKWAVPIVSTYSAFPVYGAYPYSALPYYPAYRAYPYYSSYFF